MGTCLQMTPFILGLVIRPKPKEDDKPKAENELTQDVQDDDEDSDEDDRRPAKTPGKGRGRVKRRAKSL